MLEAIFVIAFDIAFVSLFLCIIAAVIYACNYIMKKLTGDSIAEHALQAVKKRTKGLGIGRRKQKTKLLIREDGYNKSAMNLCVQLKKFEIKDEVSLNDGSPWWNAVVEITEEDISALRQGKVLLYDDNKCAIFLVTKVSR